MAPSSTTMRWANNSRSAATRCACAALSTIGHLGVSLLRPYPERVADCKGQLRAVQRVEMELLDAVTLQHVDLLDGHRGRDQLARLGVVLQAIEAMFEPLRNARPATLRKSRDLREAGDRQDTGHDGRVDAARRATVAKTQEHIGVIEK